MFFLFKNNIINFCPFEYANYHFQNDILTFVNEYDPWPGAPTFRTFQLPELIAYTLTEGAPTPRRSGFLTPVFFLKIQNEIVIFQSSTSLNP